MKKRIMESYYGLMPLILVLLGLIIMPGGCKTDEQGCHVKTIKGPENDITGKWKLIKGQTVFYNPQTIDYSCDNIIYHFESDGRLKIDSDIDDIIGFDSGEYTYEFSMSVLYENIEEKFTLKINDIHLPCNISRSDLIIDDSPLDGPILHLVRIK
ncbi:MAG: hypothetical protein IPI69_13350 [Bacteroidales bacterium]|nr:hypothetical protein [Bacteroidales bacterium]